MARIPACGMAASVSAALLLMPTVVLAQYSPSASMDLSAGYASMSMNLGASQLAREQLEREAAAKEQSTAPAAPVASADPSPAELKSILAYEADRAARKQIDDAVADYYGQLGVKELEDAVRSGQFMEEFVRGLRAFNADYDAYNLGDLATYYAINIWEIAQAEAQEIKTGTPEEKALRQQITKLTAQFVQQKKMSNADKQQLAALLVNDATGAVILYQSYKNQGEAEAKAELVEYRKDNSLLGPIGRFRITASGLTP